MFSDFLLILTWWLLLLFLGLVSFPTAAIFFKKSSDLGYIFSKTITILLISYAIFLLGSLHLLSFTTTNLWAITTVITAFSVLFARKHQKVIKNAIQKSWKIFLLEEILFFVALTIWSLIRGFNPDIRGLEKFMDFGFLNAILQSQYFPPNDMWMAGKTINYYYFGHLASAVLTKLSGIPPAITYNLIIATLFAIVFVSSFSLVANLLVKTGIKRAILGGIIASFLVTLGGNLHTPIYILKNGVAKYWYPDATRFIGYNPDTNDKTIHEFPSYSFVVSDLHAHLLNLPFVLLFILLLWWFFQTEAKLQTKLLRAIPLGFLLGIFLMTNSWDFFNYGLVTGMAFVFLNITNQRIKKTILQTIIIMLGITGIALLATLPFLINFTSIAQGIFFVHTHTPLWQLAILWGAPALSTSLFFLTFKKTKENIFVLALLISAWLLVIIPETVYIKDIYIASYYRANTMFKLTYQAFILFMLATGYIVARQAELKNRLLKAWTLLLSLVTISSLLLYPYFAIKTFYNQLTEYKGLSGDTWLRNTYSDNFEAINYLKKNYHNSIILEAVGDSYTDYNHISSYTGIPTVQGWLVHEWLWRGSYEIPAKRAQDVQMIYETQDIKNTKNLLQKYNVDLVIISQLEKQKYKNIQEEKFNKIGVPVFIKSSITIYRINPDLF